MLEEIEKKAEEIDKKIEKQSFAMELLTEQRKQNKRLYVIILVILTMWFVSIGLFIYYINTTGYIDTTEIADTSDGGNACVGDNCNNGEINYGKSN